MKIVKLLPAACLIVFAFSSCKKITEDQLIKGLWQVNTVKVDTISDNYLNRLPFYTDGNDCCVYKMDFEKDGTVITYYIAHNSLQYITAGSWELNSPKEIFIKVDNFIDGVFEIEKPTLKHFILTSDENHVAAFDSILPAIDTTYTKIDMEKL